MLRCLRQCIAEFYLVFSVSFVVQPFLAHLSHSHLITFITTRVPERRFCTRPGRNRSRYIRPRSGHVKAHIFVTFFSSLLLNFVKMLHFYATIQPSSETIPAARLLSRFCPCFLRTRSAHCLYLRIPGLRDTAELFLGCWWGTWCTLTFPCFSLFSPPLQPKPPNETTARQASPMAFSDSHILPLTNHGDMMLSARVFCAVYTLF